MVNANELRIGNWVTHLDKTIPVTAGDIHYFSENLNMGDPIPLTPEILANCGFWSHMDGGYYLPEDPNDKDNLMPKSGFIFNEEMDYHYEDHYAHRSIKIESVHQLQNLYFALTGEELNVQL